MPKQMQQKDRFSAKDFFEDYEDSTDYRFQPSTQGSLALEVDYQEDVSDRPAIKKRKNKKPVQKSKGQVRKVENMVRIKSKFSFFLSAGLVMAGCLAVVLMYVQVFSQESRIADLKVQLREAQDANAVAREIVTEHMNMTELYTYATGTLGMVEADNKTTILVEVPDNSYTISNLPVKEVSESKVNFHWFG